MFGIYKFIMDRLERRSTILMIRCLIQGKSAANWKKKKKRVDEGNELTNVSK